MHYAGKIYFMNNSDWTIHYVTGAPVVPAVEVDAPASSVLAGRYHLVRDAGEAALQGDVDHIR